MSDVPVTVKLALEEVHPSCALADCDIVPVNFVTCHASRTGSARVTWIVTVTLVVTSCPWHVTSPGTDVDPLYEPPFCFSDTIILLALMLRSCVLHGGCLHCGWNRQPLLKSVLPNEENPEFDVLCRRTLKVPTSGAVPGKGQRSLIQRAVINLPTLSI